MRCPLWPLVAAVVAAASVQAGTVPVQGATASSPTISVGAGASMYPAFDPAVSRYAVHPASGGRVDVNVGANVDTVFFNGVPDEDGSRSFADVAPGEEISIIVGSGESSEAYALYVLPAGFPTLSGKVTGAVAPGHVALTLDHFDGSSSPRFEAIVDRQGVPIYTRRSADGSVMDLKRSPRGMLTVHRTTTTAGRTGTALVELDDHFREVARHETVGRVNTDNHDGLVMGDGSVWLTGYEPDPATGRTDSVIQHLSADGDVLFDWSSSPYADESTTTNPDNPDYAHINSIDVQPNGDVVASFRHFSSVWRIATQDRPGYRAGDVVWKLGGRDSSFSFAEGEDGPCAQHTATVLPNGNVLMFDNGGHSFWGARCVDQDAPWGPLVDRPVTRVVEWTIDEVARRATVARTYGSTTRFAGFAGGAYRLDNGNVLISWTPSRLTLANEVSATDEPVWELVDTAAPESSRYTSYRAQLVTVPDRIDPEVTLAGPDDGITVTQGASVPVSFSCSDRGGATLQACDGPAERRLDTSTVGSRTWTVTARDGAGRTTTTTRRFTVVAPSLPPSSPPAEPTPPPPPIAEPSPASPDLALRLVAAPWVGRGSFAPVAQDVRARVRAGRSVRARAELRNVGGTRGRFVLRAPASIADGRVQITYVHRGRTHTRALDGRGWRTPSLGPGESLRLTVRVNALRAGLSAPRAARISASSAQGRDRVRLVVRVLPRVM